MVDKTPPQLKTVSFFTNDSSPSHSNFQYEPSHTSGTNLLSKNKSRNQNLNNYQSYQTISTLPTQPPTRPHTSLEKSARLSTLLPQKTQAWRFFAAKRWNQVAKTKKLLYSKIGETSRPTTPDWIQTIRKNSNSPYKRNQSQNSAQNSRISMWSQIKKKSVKSVLERRGFKNYQEKEQKEKKGEEKKGSLDLKQLRKLVTMTRTEFTKKREISNYKRREIRITRPLLKRCWKEGQDYAVEEVTIRGKQLESKKRESKTKLDQAKMEISRKKRKDLQKLLESIEIEKQEKKDTAPVNVGISLKGSGQKLKESVELERQMSEEIVLQQRIGIINERQRAKTLVEERKASGSAPVGKKRVIVFTSGLRQTESITPIGEKL